MNNLSDKIHPNRFKKVVMDERKIDIYEDTDTKASISFGKEAMELFFGSRVTVFFITVISILILGAVFIPLISPFDYAEQNIAFTNKPFLSKDPISGLVHWFGTDQLGRDIFVRLWYGARISLTVAGAVAVIDCILGVICGSVSGYMGGAVDGFIMRFLEVINGIPYMIVVLLLMAVLPRGIGTLIIAYSLVGWTGMARLVRGQVISLKKQEFYIAARIMGASAWRIIFIHLIPNMLGIIIVHVTLDIPGIIFTEAFLSMLGMGIAPPYPSLGVMANEGIGVFQMYPMQLLVSGMFICLLMLGFNMLGDRLQDILDPKIRRTMTNEQSINHKKSKDIF